MAKKIWFLAILLLLSFIITTNWHRISSNTVVNSSIRQGSPPVVIGFSNWAGWWPWAIAESAGLFNKNGADVELRWYDDYSKSMEDLAAGHIDGNCQTLNDTISFVDQAVQGEVVVLVNDNSAGNDKIIAAAGIDSIQDLKGKRVAIEAGVVDDFLLTLALEKAGMSRDDVEIIDIETGAAAAAFVAEAAEAVGAFPPFWLTALERPGSEEIASSQEFPGAIPDLLVVTQKLIKERPEQVQALVNTWFDILEFMSKHPQQADEIMANRAGVNQQEFKLFKAGTKIFNLEENRIAFSQGNDMKYLSYAASVITDFLQTKLKSIEQKPDFSKLFNNNFIENYDIQ